MKYPNDFGYLGFSVSKKALDASGLYTQGRFPFEVGLDKTVTSGRTAMSIRGDDYRSYPGLGVLSKSYYRRALSELKHSKSEPLVVFTDDPTHASKVMSRLNVDVWQLDLSESPLQAMSNLSKHPKIVMANSTFSYLACYFSNASVIISPRPFYLSQPDWNKDLILNQEKQVLSARFTRVRLLYLRMMKRFYK